MSKIDDALETIMTGKKSIRKTKMPNMLEIDEKYSPDTMSFDDLNYEYIVKLTFGLKTIISKEDLPFVKESVIRRFKYLIYEDLIEMLNELEIAIYEQDDKYAYQLIGKIMKEMK